MRVKQVVCRKALELASKLAELKAINPGLLLVFGSVEFFTAEGLSDVLKKEFPAAKLIGCSTAGEITADGVDDGTCTVTAVSFEQVCLVQATTCLTDMADSFAAGERLGQQLVSAQLKSVLVFGPGVNINGSALVNGITAIIGTDIPITGGLAGDGGAFKQTFTLGYEGVADNAVVAVGLCGDAPLFGSI